MFLWFIQLKKNAGKNSEWKLAYCSELLFHFVIRIRSRVFLYSLCIGVQEQVGQE